MDNRTTYKGIELQRPVDKNAAAKRKVAQEKRLAKFYKENPDYVIKFLNTNT